jgi:ribonuclease HII
MPEQTKWIAGIDEAGRGSVMGPLVIAGVMGEAKLENTLRKMGVKDSKLLTAAKREKLAGVIENTVKDIIVVKVGPCKIDSYRKSGVSLNHVEGLKMVEIIKYLNPHMVHIDCPDHNLWKFSQFLKNNYGKECEMKVEHKADTKYPFVSAASIIAKVERDREIEKLREEHGDIGSGYPSDDITMKWLENWLSHTKDFPDFVRSTWETIEGLKRNRSQSLLSRWFRL